MLQVCWHVRTTQLLQPPARRLRTVPNGLCEGCFWQIPSILEVEYARTPVGSIEGPMTAAAAVAADAGAWSGRGVMGAVATSTTRVGASSVLFGDSVFALLDANCHS